jgi:lipopolysaccharide export system ATP-binding protein
MSYTDERDELAELFGVKGHKRKTGYSDELEEPPTVRPEPSPPVAAANESAEVKKPVKLRPPADIEPHPLEHQPFRAVASPPATPLPNPHSTIHVVEDEEFLHDANDLPDFPNLEFAPLEKSAPIKTKSVPPINAPTPSLLEQTPSPVHVPVLKPGPADPQRSRNRPATKKADLHFESDARLPHPANDHFLLDTRGLVKIYDGRTVVNGVDINVRPGEIVGLLGPNGAGKTTSFYMIVGLVPPNEGQVLFNGNDVTNMPMYRRARLGMGYLPQEESIFRKLTVEENIMAVMETLDISRKERQSRCEELLERFSITHIRKNVALTCSGGEKRRLTIARSLVTTPSLLMLDEPFSGVDPIAVNEIQNIVEDLRQSGLAILITDHNARQTLELVDRAYLIYEGKVLREGTRDFLINDPVSRELYLGDRFTM